MKFSNVTFTKISLKPIANATTAVAIVIFPNLIFYWKMFYMNNDFTDENTNLEDILIATVNVAIGIFPDLI